MVQAGVVVQRSMLAEESAMLAVGDFTTLFAGWEEHLRRWELHSDGLGEVMMHQALAGAALQLSFRPGDESTAWTLNISRPQANVFVTGGQDGLLTGRYYDDGVQDTGYNRLFVQRSRPGTELQRSVLQVEGLDVLEIFEQFFEKSEQVPARLVELGEARYAMVQALPESDAAWLAKLEPADIAALEEKAEALDSREFIFGCGCNADRLAGTLARMFADQADEFFQGKPAVEAICPRCGARHLLDRASFDAAVRDQDA